MPPSHSESQELTRWKAQEFDRRNLETQELLVGKVERIERELAVFKAKLGFIAALIGGGMGLAAHFLGEFFHR